MFGNCRFGGVIINLNFANFLLDSCKFRSRTFGSTVRECGDGGGVRPDGDFFFFVFLGCRNEIFYSSLTLFLIPLTAEEKLLSLCSNKMEWGSSPWKKTKQKPSSCGGKGQEEFKNFLFAMADSFCVFTLFFTPWVAPGLPFSPSRLPRPFALRQRGWSRRNSCLGAKNQLDYFYAGAP